MALCVCLFSYSSIVIYLLFLSLLFPEVRKKKGERKGPENMQPHFYYRLFLLICI